MESDEERNEFNIKNTRMIKTPNLSFFCRNFMNLQRDILKIRIIYCKIYVIDNCIVKKLLEVPSNYCGAIKILKKKIISYLSISPLQNLKYSTKTSFSLYYTNIGIYLTVDIKQYQRKRRK